MWFVDVGRTRKTIDAGMLPTLQLFNDCRLFRPNGDPHLRSGCDLLQLIGFAGFAILIYDHIITFPNGVLLSPTSEMFNC